jgi:hypothetical protein
MTVNAHVSVSAPGAAPPADGKIGKTVKVKTAPVAAVKETATGVFALFSALFHIFSNNEPCVAVDPQSCKSSIVKVHCLSTDLYAGPLSVVYLSMVVSHASVADVVCAA